MIYLKSNTRNTGTSYERKAAEYLEQQGLVILKHNYRCRQGEIDLIARDKEYLVFDVSSGEDVTPDSHYSLDAVNPAKQKKISKVARYFLAAEYHCTEIPCRFDVIGIDGGCLHWIKDAFGFCI